MIKERKDHIKKLGWRVCQASAFREEGVPYVDFKTEKAAKAFADEMNRKRHKDLDAYPDGMFIYYQRAMVISRVTKRDLKKIRKASAKPTG